MRADDDTAPALQREIVRRLDARGLTGSIHTGSVELEWTPSSIRVRSTAEEWLELGDGDIAAVQLSRTTREHGGFLARLFNRTQTIHTLHVELRATSGERIRLVARVSQDLEDAVAELPELAMYGEQVSLQPLLDVVTVAVGLGARLTRYNPSAASADAARGPLLTIDPNEPWVLVASFLQPIDAHVARIALESEGIEVVVDDEHTVSIDPLAAVALGGVKLRVRASRAEDAAEVLQRH